MNHVPDARHARTAILLAAAVLVGACAGVRAPGPGQTSSPGTSGAPTSSPATATPAPTPGSSPVGHPTDSKAIVLRAEVLGGFVPATFASLSAPMFTLYGDNTVVFRPTTDATGTGYPPFLRAKLTVDQVDALLTFALDQGHLATARDSYQNLHVADAPTTLFDIDAGGIKKVVSVYALGIQAGGTDPDAADLAALQALAGLLGNFEAHVKKGQVESVGVYQPAMYRAILSDFAPQGPPNDWPWANLTLDDFSASEATGLLTRTITSDEASKVTEVPSGGVRGLGIKGTGNKVFGLLLRPLLPDETS